MAIFTDPYANSDYIASLVSGQVSGGFLLNDANAIGWSGVSTNLGLNFTSSAVTGVGYSPQKGGNATASLQFSADGSTWKSKDGTVQPPAGYYHFDPSDLINCGTGVSLENMYTGGLSFSMWVKPDTSITSLMRLFNKNTAAGGRFQMYINGPSNMNYGGPHGKLRFIFEVPTNSTHYTINSPYNIKLGEWNHIAFHWDGNKTNEGTFIINGSVMDSASFTAGAGDYTSDADEYFIIGNTWGGGYDGTRAWPGSIGETIFWPTELTTEQLVNAYLYGSVPTGYAGRWSFYGDADPTTDSSGNDNNGTVVGATNHTDPSGPPIGEVVGGNNYVRLTKHYDSGTDKYIDLSTNYGYLNTQSFSISFWINSPTIHTWRSCIVGNYSSSAGNASKCIFVEIDNQNNINLYMNSQRYAVPTSLKGAKGEWVHWCVTRKLMGSGPYTHDVLIYQDGVLEDSTLDWSASIANDTAVNMYIGVNSDKGDDLLQTNIANLAFWDSVRTPAEIVSEYETAQVDINDTGLAHFLPIDGSGGLGAGTVVPDIVGGFDGATSSAWFMEGYRDTTRPIYSTGQVVADVTSVGATNAFYYKTQSIINSPFGGFKGGFSEFSALYTAGGGGGGGPRNLITAPDTLSSNFAFSTVSGNAVIIDSRDKFDVKILAMNTAYDCTLRKDTAVGDVIYHVPAGNTRLRGSIPVADGTDVYLDGASNTTLTYSWTHSPTV